MPRPADFVLKCVIVYDAEGGEDGESPRELRALLAPAAVQSPGALAQLRRAEQRRAAGYRSPVRRHGALAAGGPQAAFSSRARDASGARPSAGTEKASRRPEPEWEPTDAEARIALPKGLAGGWPAELAALHGKRASVWVRVCDYNFAQSSGGRVRGTRFVLSNAEPLVHVAPPR